MISNDINVIYYGIPEPVSAWLSMYNIEFWNIGFMESFPDDKMICDVSRFILTPLFLTILCVYINIILISDA